MALFFIENIKFGKDYCYSCHSAEFPIIQWSKIISFLKKEKISFYYIGNNRRDEFNIEKLDKKYLGYFKEGHYTIICNNQRMIYLKKGELDMGEFERIIKMVKERLVQ